MRVSTLRLPPGVAGLTRYDVEEAVTLSLRPPHRGLPTSTLTVVFATSAPLLCSPDHESWAIQRGTTHDVCVGGLHTRPVFLQRPDHQDGVQVQLHPLAARRILGMPAAGLTELTQEGEDVVGSGMRSLWSRANSSPPGERARLIGDGLASLADRHDRLPAPQCEILGAWALLSRSRGRMSVTEVASRVGLSSRHLSSLLNAELGVGTKQLADLMRFESAHADLGAELDRGRTPRLSDIAHSHGYTDHSHLDRAYQRFAGTSPSGWIDDEHGTPAA